MLTKAPRGTRDILPGEAEKWRFMEEKASEICRRFGYAEIRTPVFEHTELFLRGVGEVTDIVAKEMYTFKDKADRSLTLRPEGTAPVARAFLEHNLQAEAQPVKLYYIGPMFRYDRPQAGRYRQFHQFGVEVFGSGEPAVDVEVMALSLSFFRLLGLVDFTLHINSVGCPDCRQEYKKGLEVHLRGKRGALCPDCAGRYYSNPLRILDCKNERCRELTGDVPLMLDSLCGDCAVHFNAVQRGLDALGEPYLIDGRLVRGLDYYTRTAFEIVSPVLGAQGAMGGGGRYDHLLAAIGGPDIPGIGFAIGLERVLLAQEAAGVLSNARAPFDVFVATAGGATREDALKVTMALRAAGLSADMDYMGRSLKAQLKFAGKKGARMLVIMGGEELARGEVVLRDMAVGTQQAIKLLDLAAHLSALLKEA